MYVGMREAGACVCTLLRMYVRADGNMPSNEMIYESRSASQQQPLRFGGTTTATSSSAYSSA